MRYRHMYWILWFVWLVQFLLTHAEHKLVVEYRSGYKLLFKEMIAQDSAIEAKDDTIKVLKFKLNTLKSND